MTRSVGRLMAMLLLSVLFLAGEAQPVKKETKPYKVLTAGRQLTIKSTKNIQHIMLWTTGGGTSDTSFAGWCTRRARDVT